MMRGGAFGGATVDVKKVAHLQWRSPRLRHHHPPDTEQMTLWQAVSRIRAIQNTLTIPTRSTTLSQLPSESRLITPPQSSGALAMMRHIADSGAEEQARKLATMANSNPQNYKFNHSM